MICQGYSNLRLYTPPSDFQNGGDVSMASAEDDAPMEVYPSHGMEVRVFINKCYMKQ